MLRPLQSARRYVEAAGALQLSEVAVKVAYEVKKRVGYMKRAMPARSWEELPLAGFLSPGFPSEPRAWLEARERGQARFFFSGVERPALERAVGPRRPLEDAAELARVQRLRRGVFRYFSALDGDIGWPPDWQRNPFTGQKAPARRHWSEIPGYSTEFGDLKYIWEPSRFSEVFSLVRSHHLLGDHGQAELFWQLVLSWRDGNPPNRGANWWCGQEVSLRQMAWCFGFFGFADAPASTPERKATLAAMIATQAERIEANLPYARCQRNNHALSEGTGLWTTGVLFPEFRRSRTWKRLGRELLQEQALEQIYADGTHAQHSMNYERLILHDLVWSARLGELNGEPLAGAVIERIGLAARFLYQCLDLGTGDVPNFGANDGSLILPLDRTGYGDFRSVAAVGHFLVHRSRLLPDGPWNEALFWLFGSEALEARRDSIPQASFGAPSGGNWVLRSGNSYAFLHAGTYRHRPLQADMLHCDLRWRGVPLAVDAGTYSYTAPAPWNNGLAATGVHNTVTVDGKDQMVRGPRFVWLAWTRACVTRRNRSDGSRLEIVEAEHEGYRRLDPPVLHRRAVLRAGGDVWVIVDDLLAAGPHAYRLHWLLEDHPCEREDVGSRLCLRTPRGQCALEVLAPGAENVEGPRVTRGSQGVDGWVSREYGVRKPGISASWTVHARGSVRFVSVFAPAEACIAWEADGSLGVDGPDGRLAVLLAPRPAEEGVLVQSASLAGDSGSEVLAS